jgi:hypothetical protein
VEVVEKQGGGEAREQTNKQTGELEGLLSIYPCKYVCIYV